MYLDQLTCRILHPDISRLSRTEWLGLRRQHLGGSDISAALGLNRWRSPLEVWADKIGMPLPKHETSEACRWGILLEEVIRAELAERTGWTINKPAAMFQHKTIPFLSANIDGLAQIPGKGLAIVEIKTASFYKESEWADGQIPPEYYLQGQHYMSVLDLPHCVFACLLGGQKMVMAEIGRDDGMIRDVHKLAAAFWNCVIMRTPPSADGSAATSEFLNLLYPKSSNTTPLILPQEADAWIQEYLSAKADADAAEERKRLAENLLKEVIGNHEKAASPSGRQVIWKTIESSRLDANRLKKEEPTIWERYSNTATSRRFSVSMGK